MFDPHCIYLEISKLATSYFHHAFVHDPFEFLFVTKLLIILISAGWF